MILKMLFCKNEVLKVAVLSFFLFPLFLSSQEYQHYIVNELASPEMEGRGYVNDGSEKAAKFIAAQFDSLGLSPIDSSYYQEFEMKVNRFPGEMELIINSKKLTPGKDYLVDPQSGSGKGKNYSLKSINIFKPKQIEKLIKKINTITETALLIELPDTLSPNGKVFFMQTIYLLCEQWPVILLSDEKLTWGVANISHAKPLFILNDHSISAKDKISFSVNAELKKIKQNNIVGLLKSQNPNAPYFVISAHYDHLGRMGQETYFPGANDNASGVAEMLSLASAFEKTTLQHNLLFIAFAGEEAGLLGSNYFVNHPLIPLDSIDFVLNLDLSGTGDEGITVVNGSEYEKEYELLKAINSEMNAVSSIKKRGPAANSDHYPFYEKGIPSFFIYTRGGIKAYHDIYDRSETLPLNKAEDLLNLYKAFFIALDDFN